MTSFAILLILIGLFVLANAASFRDVVFGDAKINFINPKTQATPTTPIYHHGGSTGITQ